MKPRVGFLGTGWIGRSRMAAICATDAVEAVAFCDPDEGCAAAAQDIAPQARRVASFEQLLDMDLHGLVIATPSAAHADQSIAALESGLAVFCQKPLATCAAQAEAVVAAARRADRLLGVDFSYRDTAALRAVRQLLEQGELGEVFAADLVFHNAWGPDKPWFYDRALSGGGCLMDLGCHLVDAVLWLLGTSVVEDVQAVLFAKGRPAIASEVEDYAAATFRLDQGAAARLACSWNLHAGQEAEIGLRLHGTRGSAEMRNVGGSFYDFEARHLTGTAARVIASPPDDWPGRAAAEWSRRLAAEPGFDDSTDLFVAVSAAIDRIYRAGLLV